MLGAGRAARWAGLADALRGLGWVRRKRRAVDRELEARLALVQR